MPQPAQNPANDPAPVFYANPGVQQPIYLVHPNTGGGGGGDGGDAWKASVESRLNNLHNDISLLRTDLNSRYDKFVDKQDSHLKWLLGIIAASAIGLAGLMGKGFNWF